MKDSWSVEDGAGEDPEEAGEDKGYPAVTSSLVAY